MPAAVLSRAPSSPSSSPAYPSVGPQPTNSFVPYPPSSTPPPPSPLPNTAPVTQRYYEPYAQPPRTLRYAAEAAAAADASRVANWQSNPAANGISQPVNQLPRTSPTTPALEPVATGSSAALLNPVGIAAQLALDGVNTRRVISSPEYQKMLEQNFPGIDLSRYTKSIASNDPLFGSQYNPLNPFGKLWDWAPWNQPDSKNTLNPPIGAESPWGNNFPTDIQSPPAGYAMSVYSTNNSGTYILGGGDPATTLLSFKITPTPTALYKWILDYSLRIDRTGELFSTNMAIDPSTIRWFDPKKGTLTTPTNPKKQIDPAALQPVSNPDPLAPPQYQPTGRPELPLPARPYPAPEPLEKQAPRPTTLPKLPTTPLRDPAIQPNPTPKPATDPQAPPEPARNPGEAPLPFTDPNPFTDPFSPFYDPAQSPGQNPQTTPGQRPFPGSSSAPSPNDLAIPEILLQNLPKIEVPTQLKSDMCEDPCIADMHSNLNSQKPELLKYKVFDKCGTDGKPVYKEETLFVPGNQAQFIKMLLDNMADQQGAQCTPTTDSCYAAIPESAQLKINYNYPQLVIQYAEVKANGTLGDPKYSTSIPHYNKSEVETVKALFPQYTKGNRSGILILKDNSKIVVNAKDEATASAAITALSALVAPAWLVGSITSLTLRKGRNLSAITIAPKIANYYANGALDEKPTWRKYL
jgi:hypothetical protein